MTQLVPQTSWVMAELWIVLLAVCDPSLLVPIQLIPGRRGNGREQGRQ